MNPLYVDALHLDQPNWYRYEATEVPYGPDGLDSSDGPFVDGGVDDDVACLRGFSRACNLEMGVLERGNLSVEDPDAGAEWAYRADGYDYAYIDDRFYEVETESRGEGAVLSLNRTSADEAMTHAATPVERASSPIRKAIRTGEVETRRELDGANQLWSDGDTYHVVYEVASHTSTVREAIAGRCERADSSNGSSPFSASDSVSRSSSAASAAGSSPRPDGQIRAYFRRRQEQPLHSRAYTLRP